MRNNLPPKKNSKKILMIAATPFFSDRGCHIRIYSELKYFIRSGMRVNLCTYHLGNNPKDIDESFIKRTPNIPWYNKISPGASIHKIYIDFLLLLLSIKEYLIFRPDYVYVHLYEALVIGAIFKIFSLGRIKVIFDVQGSLVEEFIEYNAKDKKKNNLIRKVFKAIETVLLKFPDKIYTSSRNSYQYYIKEHAINKDQIHVLEDAIDQELFTSISKEDTDALRRDLKISNDDKVIAYSGTIESAKGVEKFIQSLPRLLEKISNVTFLFVGYGPLIEKYENELRKYIKTNKVIFTGRVSFFDLPKYLKLADYGIDPKNNSTESSGKLYNYLAAGIPIICFKNRFNFSILNESAFYIDDFSEIEDIMSYSSFSTIILKDITHWDSNINIVNEYLYET